MVYNGCGGGDLKGGDGSVEIGDAGVDPKTGQTMTVGSTPGGSGEKPEPKPKPPVPKAPAVPTPSTPTYGDPEGNLPPFDYTDPELPTDREEALKNVLGGLDLLGLKGAGSILEFGGKVIEKMLVKKLTKNMAKEAGELAAGGGLSSFSRAGEFGIKPYNVLTKQLKGTGLQAHHLIEQRFAAVLGADAKTMQSMALTPAEHQVFTNAWRAEIGHSAGTAAATLESVTAAAQKIYSGCPEILKALGY